MDEQLIDEVALHAVIYNRQKYYLNGTANGQNQANKYETKDEAWQAIAMKLRSDGKYNVFSKIYDFNWISYHYATYAGPDNFSPKYYFLHKNAYTL